MAYFTTVLQHQVNDVWRRKIEQADAQMRLNTSGKAIRDYLNDRSTLCTAGFVIRRHIQRTNPGLLEQIRIKTGLDYADLLNNLNVGWPEEFNSELARELHRLSAKQGINISRTTWTSYLSDGPAKMYSATPFKVAFSLNMDVETTEELLMSCGQDAYCFRNPEHFIYYYCQSRPEGRSWAHAENLISRYRKGVENDIYTANDASQGMTNILRSDLKHIFAKSSSPAADDDLIAYMLQHQQEFSGLSLTNRKDFLRMSQYLAILYPTYSKISSTKDPRSGITIETTDEVPVTIDPDGMPKLSELVRALFSTGGWLPTTVSRYDNRVRTASSLKRREDSSNIEYKRAVIDEEADRPFLTSVQYFVDSYSHHVDAIDRVYRRPANPGNVERRDVILFTYFFIRRYPQLLIDEETYGKELDELTALMYGDLGIDSCMDYLMEELYNITETEIEDMEEGKYDQGSDTHDYIDLFNHILKHFGMKSMYMPNPWDRFITMSLFAEDPDFFTEAVLWNTIADDEAEEASALPEEPATELLKDYSGETEDLKKSVSPVKLMVNYPFATPAVKNQDGKKEFITASLTRRKTGEKISINKCCFVFGRKPMQISEISQDYGFDTTLKSVSRNHALILFSEGSFYLADISSRGETWLNGDHLQSSNKVRLALPDPVNVDYAYPLRKNDIIHIGDEDFIFA